MIAVDMESRVGETGMARCRPIGYGETAIIGLDEVSDVINGLRNWADPFAMASWVERESEALSYSAAIEGTIDPKSQCEPKLILCVLAYSYAIGIFSSEEIVRNCRTNAAFGALSDGKYLFRDELKLFRRRNRTLLTELVARVFIRAFSEWFGQERARIAPYLDSHLRRLAIERLDVARHLDAVDD